MINYALVLPFPAKAMLKSHFHHLQLLQHLSSSRKKLGKESIARPGSSLKRSTGLFPQPLWQGVGPVSDRISKQQKELKKPMLLLLKRQ